jgi:predicted nucleotidyltransferase
MALRDELHRRRDDILAVAARHGVSNLRLFGSVARGEERADSDIDLLVDLADDRGFDDYLALIDELESLFARRVEVVIERSLSRHFRPYVEAEAQPL